MRRIAVHAIFIAVSIWLWGCCDPDQTLKDQDLRAFVIEGQRLSRSSEPARAIEHAEVYLRRCCKPETEIDSVRMGYLYGYLARAYWRTGNAEGTVRSYERGRHYLGLLSDSLQAELLQGIATSYERTGQTGKALRAAEKSMIMAWRAGDPALHIASYLCWQDIKARYDRSIGSRHKWWITTIAIPIISGLIIALITYAGLRSFETRRRRRHRSKLKSHGGLVRERSTHLRR